MVSDLAQKANKSIVELLGSHYQPKKRAATTTRGTEYKMPCPFCGGEDRFVVWPDNNTWSCRSCFDDGLPQQDVISFVMRDKSLSFPEACEVLGITLDKQVENSDRPYKDLADYARFKRVPVSVFTDAKWRDAKWLDRPGAIYPTYAKEGSEVKVYERVRFFDGEKPKYKPCKTGTPAVWYGLKRALEMADGSPIFLVNGEASVLVAQYYGVPAFCKTGGETGNLPENLLVQLKAVWQGQVVIALDCDKQGRRASGKLTSQIPNSTVIDLGLGDKGDMADYCKLYESTSLKSLLRLIPAPRPETAHEAVAYVLEVAHNRVVTAGRTLTMPYRILHPLGGFCRYLSPGKMSMFFGLSGHGKTSWIEPMMEYWQRTGHNGIFDGREFDPTEYAFRQLQRYSGQNVQGLEDKVTYYAPVTYTAFLAHQKWQEELRDNCPTFLRDGKPLSSEQIKTVAWVESFVKCWPGLLRYAPKKSYLDDEPRTEPALNAKQAASDKRYGTLTWARLFIQEQRDKGIAIDYMIFDYMQLFNLHENNAPTNAYQTALYMIKDFAIEMQIHCIVLSQVNKVNDSDARQMNKPLSVAAMQYINDAPANLTISLNLRYVESLETDWQGKPQMVKQRLPNGNYAGLAYVIKNNMALTGQVPMQADLAHYRWLDSDYEIKKVDLNED